MSTYSQASSRLFLGIQRAFLLMLVVISTGCASMYVDNATKEISSTEFKKPQSPGEVQFLFEFQTRGSKNDRATANLRERITKQVSESGLFSRITSDPVASGAVFSITLNNVPITDEKDAFSKGFLTGFTFGLVGSQVTDGYVCTGKYLPPNSSNTVTVDARHALHTAMGLSGAPPNATKAESIPDAVNTMTRQIVSNVLHALSINPDFK